jgi:hypothetical protein
MILPRSVKVKFTAPTVAGVTYRLSVLASR